MNNNYPLDNETIRTAVNLWFDDKEECIKRYGHISEWNVTNVTDMKALFKFKITFDEDIRKWDVSNVKTMESMFEGCKYFNKPLENWNISNVKNMSRMFFGCENFSQYLGKWNINNTINIKYMIAYCHKFDYSSVSPWNMTVEEKYQAITDELRKELIRVDEKSQREKEMYDEERRRVQKERPIYWWFLVDFLGADYYYIFINKYRVKENE